MLNLEIIPKHLFWVTIFCLICQSTKQCIELANCSLNTVDMAYFANSLHSEHIVKLDLSGHEVADLFRKLLHRCCATLTSLALEECGLDDDKLDLLTQALTPCRGVQELKILGNPLWAQLRRAIFSICWLWVFLHWGTVKPCVYWYLFGCFSCNLIVLHCLRYVELPVPRDCYPEGVTYPLDDRTLINYDTEKFQQARTCWHPSEGGKRTYRCLHAIIWSLWSWHQWDKQWAGSLHAALLQQCHRKLHWHSQQCYPTGESKAWWSESAKNSLLPSQE